MLVFCVCWYELDGWGLGLFLNCFDDVFVWWNVGVYCILGWLVVGWIFEYVYVVEWLLCGVEGGIDLGCFEFGCVIVLDVVVG